jgi:flagellar P-ring protein precursor FlgI
MKLRNVKWISMLLMVVAYAVTPVAAVQVQDIARLKGSESNKIVGMGLVVGLNGTGDGGKFAPAMRPLAQMIGRFVDPNTIAAELKDVKNVALVSVTAELSANGVREGDRVDVKVSSIGPAKSLKGGTLFMIPLMAPRPGTEMIFAFAEGSVSIEDEDNPTVGKISKGAVLTRDIMTQHVKNGQVTLVINAAHASWPVARNLAQNINDELTPEGPPVARAIDPKNVTVQVPMWERNDPSLFLSKLLVMSFPTSLMPIEARVVINERTGTIIMSGNVEISPIMISKKGLTITRLNPAPVPDAINPDLSEDRFIGIDPADKGGTRLEDLIEAFNQLKVEAQDRIEIIKAIDAAGHLHAKLIFE